MKKSFLKILSIFSFIFFLASCASTASVAPQAESEQGSNEEPETKEELEPETVAQKQEDIANNIAEEINKTQNAKAVTEESSLLPTGIGYVSTAPSSPKSHNIENNAVTSENNDVTEENNAVAAENNSVTENNEDEIEERVSDEDSNLEKDNETAPTTDERGKVSEYLIFDEPEVIVLDLPEEEVPEEKAEEIKAESELQADTATTENTEISESTEAEEAPKVAEETEEPKIIATNDAPAEAEKIEKDESLSEREQTLPSRSVTLKMNQYLDITYPGNGWTYIGEGDKKENKNEFFNYFGRKLGSKNTTFSLRAKKSGKTLLHFYKNDALTGDYIDDYLEVTIEDKKATGRVKAPTYADIVPAQPQRRLERENEVLLAQDDSPVLLAKTEENKDSQVAELPQNDSLAAEDSQNNSENAQSAQNEAAGKELIQEVSTDRQLSQNTEREANIKTVIQTAQGDNNTRVENLTEPPETTPSSQSYAYAPISSQSEEKQSEMAESTEREDAEKEETVTLSKKLPIETADESLLEKAKKEFEEKKFADALRDAQEYYNNAQTRLDEALYLLGQISESNSNIRDIRFAVDSYDMLIKRFPASKYWKEAKQRSIYLKRFYIDIR
ncbi:MAG: hypothetical protein IJ630_04180 [Treponema sp.]|nr:hypothetical protein [Treponema sp.]